jgi:uncharacterized protein YqjF (DUF2071 family)
MKHPSKIPTPTEDAYPEACPHSIERPTMRMRWEELTMLHWSYPPEQVQRLLPPHLTVDTFGGSAWVGLVPFMMRIDVPVLPDLPRLLHFPETNVRTYVRDRHGRPAVWFFSLEASSLPAVLTARIGYRVPYTWADMSIERTRGSGPLGAPTTPDRLIYRSRRRWPAPKGATSVVDVTVGPRFGAGEADAFDRFLTARWALNSVLGPLVIRANMYHEPWPLYRASVNRCDDELVAASGLEQPTEAPLAHYSPGVSVRCGWPQLVSSRA